MNSEEDDLLVGVQKLATLTRWRWHHVRRSDRALQMGDPGFPDLVLVGRGQLIVAELKSTTGRVDGAQEAWLHDLTRAGVETHLWRPGDMDAIIRRLT